jgi:hypothetical protein
MILNLPHAPNGATEYVKEHVVPLLLSHIELSPALPIYSAEASYFLRAQSDKSRGLLASAKLTSWQYLVLYNGASLGAAELVVRGAGGDVRDTMPTSESGDSPPSMKLASFFTGPYTRSVLDTIRIAEALHSDLGPHELRILRAPAVYLYAVWLHLRSDPTADRLIPAAPAPGRLEANQVLTEEELVTQLEPLVHAAFDPAAQV